MKITKCPYADGICGTHAQCKKCDYAEAYATKPKFEVYSGRDLVTKDDLENAVRISIANSIVNGSCDVISETSGEVVTAFRNGLAIWIDASFYYAISAMLRKLYKHEEVEK